MERLDIADSITIQRTLFRTGTEAKSSGSITAESGIKSTNLTRSMIANDNNTTSFHCSNWTGSVNSLLCGAGKSGTIKLPIVVRCLAAKGGRPIEPAEGAARTLDRGLQVAPAFQPMQHRIQRAGTKRVAVAGEFLNHPLPAEPFFGCVVQDVQPNEFLSAVPDASPRTYQVPTTIGTRDSITTATRTPTASVHGLPVRASLLLSARGTLQLPLRAPLGLRIYACL